ncbi:MAG: hypothetical protein ACC634_07935 [Hyphomicrobiales bacterium]
MTQVDFVIWSYSAVGIGVAGLALYIWVNLRRQVRLLATLEKRGLSRRRPTHQEVNQ